jgi:hypothetical protein
MTRLARQYAPKHIGHNEKNKYKIFHAAGQILRCTAQSWLYFTRLAKIPSSYIIDSERGQRAS